MKSYAPFKKIVIYVTIINVFNVILLYTYSIFIPQPSKLQFTYPRSIAVIAPHQDDCVIQAGGLALKNIKSGGEVFVIYLTKEKNDANAEVRKIESKQAWQIAGVPEENLYFLDYTSEKNWSDKKLRNAKIDVVRLMQSLKPNVVVFPLLEHGNYEHDLTNKIISNIESERVIPAIYYQATEYNPYYIAEYNPSKMLSFLARLMPYVPYSKQSYGINPKLQTKVELTQEEMNTKIRMLEAFTSQAGVIPVDQFGFPDTFEQPDESRTVVFNLGGKYFSLVSLYILGCLMFFLFLMGIMLGLKNSRVNYFLGGLIVLPLGVAFFVDKILLKEELLLFMPVLSGLLFIALFRTIRKFK